jgi:hypothetical protein
MTTHGSTSALSTTGDDRPAVGLGSKVGLGSAVLLAVLAAIDAIAGDKIDSDTKFLVGSSVAATITTVLGRMYQQAMLYLAKSRTASEHGLTAGRKVG